MLLIAWRGLSADALVLIDSRYDAERWLHANVGPRVPVAFVGGQGYLPRFEGLSFYEQPPSIESTLKNLPPFVVVNVEWVRRFPPGSDAERWWEWFSSATLTLSDRVPGQAPAGVVGDELRAQAVYGTEDQYTNFGKVNPDIAVFKPVSEASQPGAPAPATPVAR